MLLRDSKKKILPNVWMAAGGHREFNEGLFECAKREVFEETGLKIKNLRIRATGNAYLKDLNREFFFHMLVADYVSGKAPSSTPDGKFCWMTSGEIICLDNLLAELKYVIPYICDESLPISSYKAVYEIGNMMTHFEFEKQP